MPDSSPMSTIFFSSSPKTKVNNLDDEVDRLVTKAQATTRLTPGLAFAISAMGDAFFAVFGRQAELIKSRSQAFEDCHVTVYDKVLLVLTQNGTNLGNPAAVSYYCQEYFGINPICDREENKGILANAVNVPTIVTQVCSPPDTVRESAVTLKTCQPSASSPIIPKANLFPKSPEQIQAVTLAALASHADPSLSRLWTIYEKAKNDYIAVADLNNEHTASCARFLRDTAENILTSLQNKDVDNRLLIELFNTHAMSKRAAIMLTGGKKRKFDGVEGFDYPGTTKQQPRTHARPLTLHSDSEKEPSEMFSGHIRAMKAHRSQQEIYSRKQHSEKRAKVSATTRNDVPKKEHKGRGPSGVPYGYTRPVDSYYPAGYP